MGVKKYLIQDYNYSSQALGEKKWGLAEYSLAYYRHNGYLTWGGLFFSCGVFPCNPYRSYVGPLLPFFVAMAQKEETACVCVCTV